MKKIANKNLRLNKDKVSTLNTLTKQVLGGNIPPTKDHTCVHQSQSGTGVDTCPCTRTTVDFQFARNTITTC